MADPDRAGKKLVPLRASFPGARSAAFTTMSKSRRRSPSSCIGNRFLDHSGSRRQRLVMGRRSLPRGARGRFPGRCGDGRKRGGRERSWPCSSGAPSRPARKTALRWLGGAATCGLRPRPSADKRALPLPLRPAPSNFAGLPTPGSPPWVVAGPIRAISSEGVAGGRRRPSSPFPKRAGQGPLAWGADSWGWRPWRCREFAPHPGASPLRLPLRQGPGPRGLLVRSSRRWRAAGEGRRTSRGGGRTPGSHPPVPPKMMPRA